MNTFHFYNEVEVVTPRGNKELRRVAFSGIKKDHEIHIGISMCSPRDVYNKKLGRTISLGRAQKKPNYVIQSVSDKPSHDFVEACKQISIEKL
jgi:hypothetical protein